MAAPTFFGVATNPADGGSANEPATLSLTPPASMLVGDLVVMFAYNENGSVGDGKAINATGGQTWTTDATGGSYEYGGTAAAHKIWWCTFNGTWSANPSVDFPALPGTRGVGLQMLVFRPDSTSKIWYLDTGPTWAGFSAPSTPFTVSITAGYTPANDDSVTIARWCSDDDNTWGALTGGGSPNNWQKNGLGAQYANQGGSDLSTTYAYVLLGTKQPIENVSQNQLTLGGDAGSTVILTFRAAADSRTANLTQTLANAAFSGDVDVIVGGSLSQTLAAATLAASTGVLVQGALTQTLGDATLSATATAFTGADLSQTLGDAALSASASAIAGAALTATLEDAALSASAANTVGASLSASLEDAALSADAGVLVLASLAQTLEATALSASASAIVGASLAVTLEDVAFTGDGTVIDPGIVADLDQTLEAAALSASAVAPVAAALDVALEDAALVASGAVSLTASLAETLEAVGISASVGVLVSAALTAALEDVSFVASGTVQDGPSADLDVTLEDAAVTSDASVLVVASLQQALDGVQFLGTVNVVVVGSLTQTLGDVSLVSDVNTGAPRVATLDVVLEDVALDADGTADQPPAPTPPAGTAGGGQVRRRRRTPSFIGVPDLVQRQFELPAISAALAAQLDGVGFYAAGSVYGESTVGRRRRQTIKVLLTS